MIEIKPYIEHAVLVGLITPDQPEDRTKEYLDELAFLADTHGIVPVKRFTQRVQQPNTATYVGEGKLEEIRQYIIERERANGECDSIDVVIFDDELTPRQIRNLEKAINHREKHPANVRVIDRTILILEIFLQRAQTSYAKTQVEMAHLQYMLCIFMPFQHIMTDYPADFECFSSIPPVYLCNFVPFFVQSNPKKDIEGNNKPIINNQN